MASFAALEARVTEACIRHLANVTVLRAIGEPFDAILTKSPADAFGLVSGVVIRLRIAEAAGADLLRGDALSIGGVAYTVSDIEDASASGDCVVRLEAA